MSDFYNKYPYTDFHELNLDWVIERVKKLTEDWLATHEEWVGVQQDWADTEQAWIDFKAYVENYLNNLDVQDEIDHKIDQMVADGSLRTLIQPDILAQTISTTTDWLNDHITQPTTPVVDKSLSIPGAAADAAVTGDRVNDLRSISEFNRVDTGELLSLNAQFSPIEYTNRVLEMSFDGSVFQSTTGFNNNRINCFSFVSDTIIRLTFTRTVSLASPLGGSIGFVSDITDIVDEAAPDTLLIHDIPDIGVYTYDIFIPSNKVLFVSMIYGYCTVSAVVLQSEAIKNLDENSYILNKSVVDDFILYSNRVVKLFFQNGTFHMGGLDQFRTNEFIFTSDTLVEVVTTRTNTAGTPAGYIGYVNNASQLTNGGTFTELLYEDVPTVTTRRVQILVPANKILCVTVDVDNCDSQVYRYDSSRIRALEKTMANTVYDSRNLLFYGLHVKDHYYNNIEYSAANYDYFIVHVENGHTYHFPCGIRFLCKQNSHTMYPETTSNFDYTADFTGYIYVTLNKQYDTKWIMTESNDLDILPFNVIRNLYAYGNNAFNQKTILNIGDSISENRVGSESYSHQFASTTGAVIKRDSALSGSTLSRTSDQGSTGCIYTQAENAITAYPEADAYDIIMIDGGANDFSLNRTIGSVVGTAGQYVLADYTATFDETTVLGAVEGIFKMLRNAYYGAMIVFVIPHKHDRTGATWEAMLDGIRLACDKWSIPVLDMDQNGELNTRIVGMRTGYTDVGGTHPTTLGIKKFYLPMLIGLLSDHII